MAHSILAHLLSCRLYKGSELICVLVFQLFFVLLCYGWLYLLQRVSKCLEEQAPRDTRILCPAGLQLPLELHKGFQHALLFLCKTCDIRLSNCAILEVSLDDDLHTNEQSMCLVLSQACSTLAQFVQCTHDLGHKVYEFDKR